TICVKRLCVLPQTPTFHVADPDPACALQPIAPQLPAAPALPECLSHAKQPRLEQDERPRPDRRSAIDQLYSLVSGRGSIVGHQNSGVNERCKIAAVQLRNAGNFADEVRHFSATAWFSKEIQHGFKTRIDPVTDGAVRCNAHQICTASAG